MDLKKPHIVDPSKAFRITDVRLNDILVQHAERLGELTPFSKLFMAPAQHIRPSAPLLPRLSSPRSPSDSHCPTCLFGAVSLQPRRSSNLMHLPRPTTMHRRARFVSDTRNFHVSLRRRLYDPRKEAAR